MTYTITGMRVTESQCTETLQTNGDGIDNDCDNEIDEETCDNIDNDLDGRVDEDCSSESFCLVDYIGVSVSILYTFLCTISAHTFEVTTSLVYVSVFCYLTILYSYFSAVLSFKKQFYNKINSFKVLLTTKALLLFWDIINQNNI